MTSAATIEAPAAPPERELKQPAQGKPKGMRLELEILKKRWPSPWEAYSLAILLGAAIYIPLSYTFSWMPELKSPLRYLGGACPLCGGTRAVTALVTGQLLLALKYNPLALIIFALFIWSLLSYLFIVIPFKRRIVLKVSKQQRRVFWGVVLLAFVANWAYVLYAGMYAVPLKLSH
jgi:hypothetical protein